MAYKDILKRISEIVNLSDNVRNNLDLLNQKENFIKIRSFNIYKDYVEEFNNLLDTERTFYLLHENKDNSLTEKNDKLLELANRKIQNGDLNSEDYLKLIEILNNSYNKNANDLTEVFGYYVLKHEVITFNLICKKLEIGPYALLKNSNPEESKTNVIYYLKNNNAQGRRIKKYIEENSERKFTSSNDSLLEIDSVKFDYDTEKNDKNVKIITDIDELIAYFVLKRNINIEALKQLIPTIGIYNYQHLINRLFAYGAIDEDVYRDFLQEYMMQKK